MSIPSIVAQGRRLLRTTFLDTCVIGDRTEVRDNKGGKTTAWHDRDEQEPCRFTSLSDDLPVQANGTTFGVPVAVWVAPVGVEASEGDRLTNLIDGSKWIITSNLTPPSELAVATRMGIREAQGGETD